MSNWACALSRGGGRLIEKWVTEMGGRIPISVSGGFICKGEPVGASHLGQN